MSLAADPTLAGLNDCGCCAGVGAQTPAVIENRPGLSAIAYRVGTHARFKQTMLAALSDAGRPALGKLTARGDDDFAVALLDAWAVVADVLTFYQERIANESYLRTATERRSVLEIVRAIGYELNPGVAADAFLAFTLEDAPGAPATTTIAARTRAQSVPGPGERPQTFETVATIEARAAWNALRARQSRATPPAFGDTDLFLAGVATGLRPGDPILLVGAEREADVDSERWELRRASAVEPDAAANRTRVVLDEPLGSVVPRVNPPALSPRVFALRLRASLFGHNAPRWETLPVSLRVGEPDPRAPGTPGRDPSGFLAGAFATREKSWAEAPLAATTRVLHLDTVYPAIAPDSWIALAHPPTPPGTTPAATAQPGYAELYRVTSVAEETRADFNISAKVTRVGISGEHTERFAPRTTTVFAQSELLEMAERPLTGAVEGGEIILDRIVEGLLPGHTLLVRGGRPGAPEQMQSERATLKEAVPEDAGHTKLVLKEPLANTYDRAGVTIFANVAPATHGESVLDEALGSGDAGQAYQQFPLRQSPLTYTSAPNTPGGARSTLEVRVNEVRWDEVSTLFGHGPRERVYITRTDDAAKTTVVFGDGKTGARLPTGRENVRATYRKGIGREGNVAAEQISLLLTRPLGVKAVTNPLPAGGAADPQSQDDARTNAPLTVLTLDRIVSVRDYEDFARSFAGIAKAHAVWTWNRDGRGVFVTVAGPEGDPVPAEKQAALQAEMARSGDARVPVRIASYRPASFRVQALLRRDPARLSERVLADAEAALRARFGFAARAFGQPVAQSEVVAVLHGVPGVVSVDVAFVDAPVLLPAAAPRPGEDADTALPAELLLLDLRPGDVRIEAAQ